MDDCSFIVVAVFIYVPEPLISRSSSVVVASDQRKICGLDPGVRTFMTSYDQDGVVTEYGTSSTTHPHCRDSTRVFEMGLLVDRLQSMSMAKSCRHRRRYKLRKAMARIRDRIRHMVDDLH